MYGQEGIPPRVAAVPLVGPEKGRRNTQCRLGSAYIEDKLTPIKT
jgi:hypothetical protein